MFFFYSIKRFFRLCILKSFADADVSNEALQKRSSISKNFRPFINFVVNGVADKNQLIREASMEVNNLNI